MSARTIERYRKSTIWIHWLHTLAFLALIITGALELFNLVRFEDAYIIWIIHRTAAILFVSMPIISYLFRPASTIGFIKETFAWVKHDLRWFKTAPDYYFGGPEENMPSQGHINTGQKLWQLVVLITGLVFVLTGTVLWFFKWNIQVSAYQWVLWVHGVSFIIVFAVFLIHVYVGVFHPRFRESFRAILDGKISPSYAMTHYRKWYDRITNKGS